MGKKRDKLTLIFDVLNVIRSNKNAIKPTRLLRYSNLSSQGFLEYYGELLNRGFVQENKNEKGRKTISLTDKGFKFLEKYQMIRGFIDDFELNGMM